MILSICCFDNLNMHILFEIFILMPLTLQVVVIEVVTGAVVEIVNNAVAVVIVVVCTYCHLVD